MKFLRISLLVGLAIISASFSRVQAQASLTWSGATSTTWTVGTNWGGTAPSSSYTANIANFNSATYTNQPNSSAAATDIAGITVGGSSGALTITAATGNGLSIGASGITIAAGANTVSINNVSLGLSQSWANNSSSLFTVSNKLTNAATNTPLTLTINGSGTGGTTISGIISNGAGTSTTALVINTSGGVTTLTQSNTFTGGVNIEAGTLIAATSVNALGVSGTNSVNIASGGTLGLQALESIGALTGSGTVTDSSASASEVLTIGNGTTAGTVSTFSGTLEDGASQHLQVTTAGAGTEVLSGTNTYSGKTTLGGTSVLNLGSTGALSPGGSIAFTGGTLQYSSSNNTDYSSRIASSTSAISIDTNSQNIQFSSNLSNSNTGGLTKLGLGTLTLGGTDTYTGPTQVNAGNLSVTGSLAPAITSTLTVGGVNATGTPTLQGVGTISEQVILSGSGSGAAGTIMPGTTTAPTGTLHVGGGVGITFSAGSDFALNMSGAASGELIISGVASISSGADITINVGSALTQASYTLATATSGLGSSTPFTLVGSLPSNYQLVYTGTALDLNQIIATTSTTYTLATTASLTLLHSGATTTLTTTVANTGTGSADTLNYSGLGAAAANGSVTGTTTSGGPLANSGGSASNTQTYTATTAGSDTITPTGSGTNATLGGSATQTGTTTATINVYSGAGVWNTNGSGSWGTTPTATPANWTVNGGIPGITAGFTTTDSASFGAVTTTGTAVVSLNGASPYLNAITFSDGAASYNIAQGSGGMFHLDSTSTATVTVSAGSDTISAPIELDSNAATSVASSDTLTVSGNISQSGTQAMTINGPGTTVLSGSNSYSGGTTVTSTATLLVSNTSGSASGTGALTVNGGSTIGGYGTSSGTSFSISGTGTATGSRANILVGLNSTSDANTTHILTLVGSGASTIQNANLTFNLNATQSGALGSDPSGSGTELSVGNTAISFGTNQGSVKLTLNLQNEPAIVAAYTPYVLIAGTVASGGSGANGSQYTGLTLGTTLVNSGGVTETVISGNNLAMAFGNSTDQSYYSANSYLVLYQNTNTGVDDIDVEVVPEPGTWALMIGGLAILVFWQRRKNKLRAD